VKVNRQPPRPTDAPPRTPRGEARRAALLKEARAVFLEEGYEGASIEEIVRRTGGSKASLYSYFGSKEGLFWELLVDLTNEFMQELQVPDHADADMEGTLTAIGHRYLKVLLDPAGRRLFRTMIAESARFPKLAQSFFERGPARGRRALAEYLRLQNEAGRLDCRSPEFAAVQFLELIKDPPHSRVLLSLPPFPPGRDPESHVADAVRLFLYGCTPRPATSKSSRSTR
jgi:TetR/AcrR family transcriptional repressor of mexJK operon